MNVGPALRSVRERHHKNLKEFGEMVGYDRSYVSRVEQGERSPSLEYISAVMVYADSEEVFSILRLAGFSVDPLAVTLHQMLQEESPWSKHQKLAMRLVVNAALRSRK